MALIKFSTSKNWYSRFMIDGKVYQRTTRTADKKLAQRLDEQWYKETLEEMAQLADREITLGEAFEKYRHTASNRDFQQAILFYPPWLEGIGYPSNTTLSALDTKFFHKIVMQRKQEGRAASTINHMVVFFNQMLKWAKANRYKVAPYETVKVKDKANRLVYLKPSQEQALLYDLDPKRTWSGYDSANEIYDLIKTERTDNFHLALLLLDTGARLGEILSLEWRNVNVTQGFIELFREKVGNESIIYLTERCRTAMNERFVEKGRSKWVFPARKSSGHRTCVGALRRAIKKTCGSEFTVHSLRHTCATKLVKKGVNLYEVQNQLGHTGPAMTQRYAHLAVAEVSMKVRDALNEGSTQSDRLTDFKENQVKHKLIRNNSGS